MSGPSYRLEAPRPRPPPIPIRALSGSRTSTSNTKDARHSLLYELPPTSPRSMARGISPGPTSPVSPFSSQARAARGRRMTPPPPRTRSTTPSRPMQSELEEFTERCRAWYYNQDDNAGRLMTQTLATLPPSQRAPFARLQASVRSAYHASVNARRDAEFKAHLSATNPGCSLTAHSRADPRGALAQKERCEKLEQFIRTWCTVGMPGTKPFFEGLWAVMRLQLIPEHLGGAGGFRIEWEIDDAVFKEAAGKDFMLEAIDTLKGVLGFEEALSAKRSYSLNRSGSEAGAQPLTTIHSRSQSQPLPSDILTATSTQKAPPIASTTQTKRPRAPSDPFLDTPSLSTSYSSANTFAQLSSSGSFGPEEPATPNSQTYLDDQFPSAYSRSEFSDSDGYMRTWTFPDLTDPEIHSLLRLFPAFVMRHPLPQFPVPPSTRRLPDAETGGELQEERKIRVGTGTMRVGTKSRTSGWEGGWWTKFISWWRRVFC